MEARGMDLTDADVGEEADMDVGIDMGTDADTEVDADMGTSMDTNMGTDIGALVGTDVRALVGNTDIELEVDVDAEDVGALVRNTDVELEVDVDAEVDVDVDVDVDADGSVEANGDAKRDADVEGNVNVDVGVEVVGVNFVGSLSFLLVYVQEEGLPALLAVQEAIASICRAKPGEPKLEFLKAKKDLGPAERTSGADKRTAEILSACRIWSDACSQEASLQIRWALKPTRDQPHEQTDSSLPPPTTNGHSETPPAKPTAPFFNPEIFCLYFLALLALLPPVIGALPSDLERIFDTDFDKHISQFSGEGGNEPPADNRTKCEVVWGVNAQRRSIVFRVPTTYNVLTLFNLAGPKSHFDILSLPLLGSQIVLSFVFPRHVFQIFFFLYFAFWRAVTALRYSEEFGEETPVMVEPISMPSPRQRNRPDRPPSLETSHSTSPFARMGDLPTRLSGWLLRTFSPPSTDLSLPPSLHSLILFPWVRLCLREPEWPCLLRQSMHPGYEPPLVQSQPPPYSFTRGTLGRRGLLASTTTLDQLHRHKPSRSQHAHSSSITPSGSQFLFQSQPPSSSPSQSLSSSVSSATATPSASVYNPALFTSSTQSATSKDLKPDLYSSLLTDSQNEPGDWDLQGRQAVAWDNLNYVPDEFDSDFGGTNTRQVWRTLEVNHTEATGTGLFSSSWPLTVAKLIGNDADAAKVC
ncbi:MAG: hypothetical protein NXY57DRAFT_1068826 [Lentinula lateritia]|nr:MAG: hypothetical protein NXY57DRAFT_1068826 [Lentinula lateritia]